MIGSSGEGDAETLGCLNTFMQMLKMAPMVGCERIKDGMSVVHQGRVSRWIGDTTCSSEIHCASYVHTSPTLSSKMTGSLVAECVWHTDTPSQLRFYLF